MNSKLIFALIVAVLFSVALCKRVGGKNIVKVPLVSVPIARIGQTAKSIYGNDLPVYQQYDDDRVRLQGDYEEGNHKGGYEEERHHGDYEEGGYEAPKIFKLCTYTTSDCSDEGSCVLIENTVCFPLPNGDSLVFSLIGRSGTGLYYGGSIDCQNTDPFVYATNFGTCFAQASNKQLLGRSQQSTSAIFYKLFSLSESNYGF